MVARAAVDTSRLVFVDEMGTNTSLPLSALRLLSVRTKGPRASTAQPREEHDAFGKHEGRRDRVVRSDGRWATLAVFEAYHVEQVLVPTPRPGQGVVLDNLCSH